jgi:replication factor C small subunit
MSELQNKIWIEKYRPKKLEDLILRNKGDIIKFLDNNSSIPHFIFTSNKAGTGKTSLAKIIIKMTNSDSITINSSDERGIDTIREKIKVFAGAMSTNGKKRCIFLDEADGMTRQSQDSLRNIMETYSDNCFFILTANYIEKLIEPIKSRCVTINFELPQKSEIKERLNSICKQEELDIQDKDLDRILENSYPDIRNMINQLQLIKASGKIEFPEDRYLAFYKAMKQKDLTFIYAEIYSGTFQILEFTKFLFERLFENCEKIGLDKTSKIATEIAEVEKHYNLGANLEIIFLDSCLKIMRILNENI